MNAHNSNHKTKKKLSYEPSMKSNANNVATLFTLFENPLKCLILLKNSKMALFNTVILIENY